MQSQSYVALDQEYISREDFEKIYNQAEIVSKMDSGFIKYLQSQLNQLKQPNKLNQPNKHKQLSEPKQPDKQEIV